MSTVGKTKTGPRRRIWTGAEFYRLLELGFFEGQRVQLIEGDIIEMPAQKNFHALGITLTHDALRAIFTNGYWVRVQMTLDLTPLSVVDPDVAVVTGNPRDFKTNDNPTSALLVVEVSDTTLSHDRRAKSSLYARAGIEDYWIMNLRKQRLEVCRQVVEDPAARHGARYSSVEILGPDDSVSPLAAPQASIIVRDLLP